MRCLEQADRPARNNHINRNAGMGSCRSELNAVGITSNGSSPRSELIVRSSGVGETLTDRGSLLSRVLAGPPNLSDIKQAINDIFLHANEEHSNRTVAIVLQTYLKPDLRGHLSNESRLSPTQNQWRYEVHAIPLRFSPVQ